MEALILFNTMSVIGLIALAVILWHEHKQKKNIESRSGNSE